MRRLSQVERGQRADRVLAIYLKSSAWLAGGLLLLVVAYLVYEAAPVLDVVGPLRLFADEAWRPTDGLFGMLPMVLGSVAVTAGAILVAGPLGLLAVLFCRYYAPPLLGQAVRRVLELLAGVPSVVYGFWGMVVLVPLVARLRPPGASLLAGVAVLSVMIVPMVALLVDAALEAVPVQYTRGAAVLGMTRWGTLSGVVLPAARSGIFTAVLLATARAMGETMAVLMVCGNVVKVPASVFDPVRTLTANIALEMSYALELHRSSLFASGLLLTVFVLGLVAAAEVLSKGTIHA